MNELDILRSEHALLSEASNEWLGMRENSAGEDISYVGGVIDMVDKLLKEIRDEDRNRGLTTESQMED